MCTKRKNKHPTTFLCKIYEMVNEESLENIISWTAEGDSFIIKDCSAFSEQVLPKYFRHNNFSSFVRQLNMYDFKKIKTEHNIIFSHRLFKKNKRNLLKYIHRQTSELYVDNKPKKKHNQKLNEKVNEYEAEQNKVDFLVKHLEGEYNTVLERNQKLISMLIQYRKREERFQSLLATYSEYATCKLTSKSSSQEAEQEFTGNSDLESEEMSASWNEFSEVPLKLEQIQPITPSVSENSSACSLSEGQKKPKYPSKPD